MYICMYVLVQVQLYKCQMHLYNVEHVHIHVTILYGAYLTKYSSDTKIRAKTPKQIKTTTGRMIAQTRTMIKESRGAYQLVEVKSSLITL